MAKHTAALDRDHLHRATGGDPALIRELMGLLADDLPRRLEAIRRSLRRREFAEAADAAHKLQGSAAYTGATRLGECAARLEAAAERETDADGELRELEASIGELLAALEAESARHARSP